MRPSKLLFASVVALFGLVICSSATAAGTPPDVGNVVSYFQSATTKFASTVLAAAKWLAVILATIDVSIMLQQKLLKGDGSHEMLVAVMQRVMWFGFLQFLMNVENFRVLINGFRQLGEDGSGLSIVNPADIFWQGCDIVNLLMSKFSDAANIGGVPVPAGLAAAANPLVALMVGLILITILFAYLVMMSQYAVLLVEMYFFLACSPLIVAMAALKHGREIGIKPISSAIVMGVKFLALYFVLSVAQQMTAGVENILKDFSIVDLTPMFAVLGMAGLMAFLAVKSPAMASDLMSGTISLSGGDAVAAGAASGAAIAAVAGGAAAFAGGATSSVSAAVKAGSAAIDNARAAGATGIGSVTAGAVRALGSAGMEAASDTIKGLGRGSAAGGGSVAQRISASTASINEAKAASPVPVTSVPGSQPSAPSPGDPQSARSPALQGRGEPVAAAADRGRVTPPAPSESSAPAIDGAELPSAPGKAGRLASNLANELKQADSAQASSLNIQAPEHE
ncbi:MAG: type IV secretion system protein [Pseudomonadota bacterium]